METTATCASCGATKTPKPKKDGSAKLPGGWKRRPTDGALLCKACKKQQLRLRSITFSVAGPVGRTWDELRTTLRTCFRASTNAANALILELVRADFVRTPDLQEMPQPPKVNAYKLMRSLAPDIDSQSATALGQAVVAKYKACRLDVLWLRKAALPFFRYPQPYPLHNQAWEPKLGDDGECLVSARFGNERWLLRLSGGPGFRRQRQAFLAMVNGEAIRGEMSLYEVKVPGPTHRPNGTKQTRLMCKLVAWLPQKAVGERTGVMRVRTADDCFLLAEREDSKVLWVLNEGTEGMRQTVLGQQHAMQRLREDAKRRHQWPKGKREQIARRMSELSERQHRRMQTFVHQTTMSLASRAARSRVALVELDMREKSFMPSFPWFVWKETLKCKLEERGICLRIIDDASGEEVQEDLEVLAQA